jgi:hypothetical protein
MADRCGAQHERSRRVPLDVRSAVFDRAGGKCESCGVRFDADGSSGDPGRIATIQHVLGDSNEISNLKAFCRGCNNRDAQSRFVPVSPDSDEAALGAELCFRWSLPQPIRVCDDEKRWSGEWRKCAAAAREVLRGQDDWEESADDPDLP